MHSPPKGTCANAISYDTTNILHVAVIVTEEKTYDSSDSNIYEKISTQALHRFDSLH